MLDAMLTALERVLERGNGLPSVRALAGHAGVAVGSIYYYVREREDLVALLVHREERRISDRLLGVLSRTELTTPTADLRAVLVDLGEWRHERGWVARLPLRFMVGRSWVGTMFASGVAAGAQPLAKIAERHGIRPMTTAEELHLVGLVVGNQLAWALEMPGADDLDIVATIAGGYLETLQRQG